MRVFLKVMIRSYIFLNNVVVYFNDKVDGKHIIKTYSVAKILLSLLFKATRTVVELQNKATRKHVLELCVQ